MTTKAELETIKRLLNAREHELSDLKQLYPHVPRTNCQAINAALRSAIATLEKQAQTGDGVIIYPGMIIYLNHGGHIDEREVSSVGATHVKYIEPPRYGAGRGECHVMAKDCYSTAAAAQAAEGKIK